VHDHRDILNNYKKKLGDDVYTRIMDFVETNKTKRKQNKSLFIITIGILEDLLKL